MTRRLATCLATVLIVLPTVVRADTAATGTFDVTVTGLPPSVSFMGSIAFDAGTFMALGSSVDLASDVGPMTYSGTATVTEEPPSATFSFDATDTDFMFSGAGAGGCDNPSCLGGTATFNGRFTSLTDPGGAVPPGVYTFDGSADINFLGMGPGGRFGLNAFPALATPTGSNVAVTTGPTEFFNSRKVATATFDAEAIFTTVSTAGDTSFVGLTSVPGSPPAGISLVDGVSIFVDVETTAGVSGSVTICLANGDIDMNGMVDGLDIAVDRLRLLHADTHPFVDVTTSTPPGWVCGQVSGLSAFVLGVSDDTGSTTTTTVSPGGSTTTTTLPPCATVGECVERALGQPLCPGEEVNPKLQRFVEKKLANAQKKFDKASVTEKAQKAVRLVKKAGKQLDKVEKKAAKFTTKKKGPISALCADLITTLVAEVRRAIEESGVGVDVGGGGGGGGQRLRATIPGKPDFNGFATYEDNFGFVSVGGCISPGSGGACTRVVNLLFVNSPLGTPQEIVQSAFSIISYTEGAAGPEPMEWDSMAGSSVTVTGLTAGGRLQGSFRGTLEPRFLGGENLEISGTFNAGALGG